MGTFFICLFLLHIAYQIRYLGEVNERIFKMQKEHFENVDKKISQIKAMDGDYDKESKEQSKKWPYN